MPEGIGYPEDAPQGGPKEQIMAAFQSLPPEEQEQLRSLQQDPNVQAFSGIMRKILPPDVAAALPGGQQQQPRPVQGGGLLAQPAR